MDSPSPFRERMLDLVIAAVIETWPIVILGYLFFAGLGLRTTDFVGLGTVIGAWTVFRCIRFMNRRHDPRHAKRPPDAP